MSICASFTFEHNKKSIRLSKIQFVLSKIKRKMAETEECKMSNVHCFESEESGQSADDSQTVQLLENRIFRRNVYLSSIRIKCN
jgi:hypothetical protein